jgi:hypothetical protein
MCHVWLMLACGDISRRSMIAEAAGGLNSPSFSRLPFLLLLLLRQEAILTS